MRATFREDEKYIFCQVFLPKYRLLLFLPVDPIALLAFQLNNMPFHVLDDSGQGTYFILLIVGTLISIVAITLRFVATLLSHQKPGLEDWLALSALAFFLSRVGVACNGLSVRFIHVYIRSHCMPTNLTLVYVLKALRYVDDRGLQLALDRVIFEKAFKVC